MQRQSFHINAKALLLVTSGDNYKKIDFEHLFDDLIIIKLSHEIADSKLWTFFFFLSLSLSPFSHYYLLLVIYTLYIQLFITCYLFIWRIDNNFFLIFYGHNSRMSMTTATPLIFWKANIYCFVTFNILK